MTALLAGLLLEQKIWKSAATGAPLARDLACRPMTLDDRLLVRRVVHLVLQKTNVFRN